jgi:hypothetical protein
MAVIAIPMDHVGLIEAVEPGVTKDIAGATRVAASFLAAGDPETTLAVMGTLVITTPITEIGFKKLRVMGVLLAPEGSEAALGERLDSVKGVVAYYPLDKGAPRFFMDKAEITAEFMELLPEAGPWVIVGQLTFDASVTPAMVRDRVTQIILTGEIRAPRALQAQLRVLATDMTGAIVATDEG